MNANMPKQTNDFEQNFCNITYILEETRDRLMTNSTFLDKRRLNSEVIEPEWFDCNVSMAYGFVEIPKVELSVLALKNEFYDS